MDLMLHPRSVLDVGCGRGNWLAQWIARGIEDVYGIDGDYVRRDRLLVDPRHFSAVDIQYPFDLGRRFDLITCLEVAEHLMPECSEDLVRNLCKHGDVVLFSAATRGQGGENHINERSLSFWQGLFSEAGFSAFDAIRPVLRGNRDVERWYRFNTILYVRSDKCKALPIEAQAQEVALGALKETGDAYWRLRRSLLYPLPEPLVTALAQLRRRIAWRQY